MSKLVSVVIPVYNGEKYLERCIDSIVNQKGISQESLEIILIDDGSSDRSRNIIKKYSDMLQGVVSLSHKNKGVAKTRNKGIEISSGQYLMFVDQDDFLEETSISRLYEEARRGDYDVVMSGLRRPKVSGGHVFSFIPKGRSFDPYILVSAWAKIHKRSFLVDNHVAFFDSRLGEDTVFSMREIMQAGKIGYISEVTYNWFYNDLSVSNTEQRGLTEGFGDLLIDLLNSLRNEFEDRRSDTSVSGEGIFNHFLLYTVCGYLGVSGRYAKTEDFTAVFNKSFDWLDQHARGYAYNYRVLFGERGVPLKSKLGVALLVAVRLSGAVGKFAKIYCRG